MVEQFSSRDLSLDSSDLGKMVEDAHRGYCGPIFMDLTFGLVYGYSHVIEFRCC